ncbi:MAG: sn-glycerol-3-phosphate ABC transporter substrate-binding protein [Treponema sp. GWB1_62_6]|nr:MAG: sn-glycerol-3-phosphate ABC transporter substrate-binding protein [Treponema sp. GWA1_62_8]OHE64542.1 MAG: sn-glycerol-3-phosphate ABC transporter substrate-binding protein [Treponema sp. GWB1_62_6]OHE67394.1 MAG: sn-glycerol-3-phosphate ABC transporter substrate-binding protein [Treponema sp. GWC1_61_84]OHE74716.1 MAG: sn-glycerol-3-phosphate ABC transporter substrate-binding protein [Treponema sp. RIFOXYC1_FULL_61_9]HCM27487.1 sn-glycerol-3-phosphate ABC transporter substrate-binding 
MKRFPIAAAVLLVLATGLYAQTNIEFWHAMTGKNGEMVQALSDKFNASQSSYKVTPVYKGSYSDTMNAGIAAFRAGQAPAILQVYEVGTATMMAAKGAVKPVYQLMAENNEKFDPNIYIPTVKGYYTDSQGKMLSMPFNSSTSVMYYNKDAFRKAGLDPEKPPVTWPQFFETARKLKASGMEGGYTTAWISWIQLENFSAWHNVPFGTKSNGFEGLDTQLVFNTPLQVKHFTQIAQDAKDKVFIYGGREGKCDPLFISGQVGMVFQSIGANGTYRKSAKFDYGVTRLPYYPDVAGAPQNSIIGGASLWVLNGRTKPEYQAVADFFSFISTPEMQSLWHRETGYVPVTTAAYEYTKALGFYKDNPGHEIAIKQLLNKEPTANSKGIRFGNFNIIREIEDQVWEDILADKISVKDGLDKMVKDGNAKLREFERLNK